MNLFFWLCANWHVWELNSSCLSSDRNSKFRYCTEVIQQLSGDKENLCNGAGTNFVLEHLLDYLDNHDLSDLNVESVYKYIKDRVKNPAYGRH